MTNPERLRAFEMRLNGATWAAIGLALNYDKTTVKNDLANCIQSTPRQVNCCYPAIRRIITDDYGGSIRAFADHCGISANTLYYLFAGRSHRPEQKTVDIILSVTGLPYEEAFAREED